MNLFEYLADLDNRFLFSHSKPAKVASAYRRFTLLPCVVGVTHAAKPRSGEAVKLSMLLSQSFNAKHCPRRITCITRDRKPLRGFAKHCSLRFHSILEIPGGHSLLREAWWSTHAIFSVSFISTVPQALGHRLETYVYNRLMMRCSIDKATFNRH